MEVLVDCYCHVMANAEHCSERVGTQAHVRVLAHVLEALTLFLHRVVVRAQAIDDNVLCLNLNGLSLALALDERALDAYAGTGGYALEFLCVHRSGVYNDLHVLNS